MANTSSSAETLLREASDLVTDGRFDAAKNPAWSGVKAAIEEQPPEQDGLSDTAKALRLVLIDCGIPSAQVDQRIGQIYEKVRGALPVEV